MIQHARRFVTGLACIAMSAAAVPARGATETMDNPSYAAWAKFKPGSSVTMTADMTMNNMKMQVVTTTTLVSVTADQVALSIASKVSMMGQEHPGATQTKTVPAKTPKQPVQQVGTADVTAAGKTYPCKILEVSQSSVNVPTPGRGAPPAAGAAKGTAKLYVNDTVPGGAVKVEVTAANGALMTMLLTDVSVK